MIGRAFFGLAYSGILDLLLVRFAGSPDWERRPCLRAMPTLLFWIFAGLTLGSAVAVVANRNPVASALSLVVCFLGLAALFVGLDAYFLAVVQVLVYAGAVMVLFLFIIMLLDLKAERGRPLKVPAVIGAVVVAGLFVAQLAGVLGALPGGPMPALAGRFDDARNVGMTLFAGYNLPLQVVGVLILTASVGVVVLGKRELK